MTEFVMEDLTERIAGEVGPKWVQLLSRLQVDYRLRYQLCVKYKDADKTAQEANCTRDTIRQWQKGLGDISERETMTRLLAAFRTVKGFDERAQELALSYGISLNPPQPPVTSSELTTTANTTTANVTPTSSSPGRIATDTGSTLPILPLATHAQSLMVGADVDAKGEGRDDDTESSKGLSFNILTTHEQLPKFRPHSPTLSSASSTERADDYHLLNSPIDVSIMKHKYAILDVCQRLPPSVMTDFAQRLNVPQETVTQITDQVKMHEERYYQVLKFWLEGGGRGGKRTFMELRDALKSCNQQTASDVVLRRLQSPGLTLRTSPVL